jgi:hypothetical protein
MSRAQAAMIRLVVRRKIKQVQLKVKATARARAVSRRVGMR